MVFFGNVRLEVEPFEESQGAKSPKSVASPDELKAFYSDMERQEIVQRNLSRRKSGSARSLFSRKTVPVLPVDTTPPPVTEIKTSDQEKVLEREHVEEIKDQVPSVQSRSIIPDQLQELPAWYTKEDWAGVNIPFQKMRCPIHNPVGPRWYINHHLLPSFRSTQLPSIFSHSFPPMAPTVHEASQDSTRASDPNRTPSGSPLPTPTSSETRIVDTGGRRSRKTSQTAHDTVDLLDVSDPWGTNWHHQSPYDIGLNTSPVSPDVPESSNQTRSRVSSMTTGQRRRTMPSPLSQSTSAIHLQAPDSGGSRPPRKLSKSRKPVLGNLFRSHSNSVENGEPKAVSPPATPIEDPPASQPTSSAQEPPIKHNASKRNSQSIDVAPLAVVPQPVSVDKKVKRGSVLGRLARRFSIMRKPLQEPIEGLTGRDSDDWHHVAVQDANSDGESRRSAHVARQPSPEKQQPDPRRSIDPIKRIPPPSLQSGADRSSSISVEAPFSIGRLTIANPDTSSESAATPNQRNMPLPPDLHPKRKPEDQCRPTEDTSDNSALPADPPIVSPDSPPQLNVHPSSAPSRGSANFQKQQSPAESAEGSQATDYLMSKLLPDPFPSPTRSGASPEILQSPAAIEDHKPEAIPGPSTARPTQLPVGFTDVNTHDSQKTQRPGPSVPPQTQSSAGFGNASRAGPPVSESRAWKPASGLTRTRLVKEPAERTSRSGRPRPAADPPVPSAVPFPFRVELLPGIPSFDPIRLSAASMVVDSPLSAASMFVHPPTPHDSPESVPIYAPPLPPKSLEDKPLAPHDIPATKVKNEGVGSGRQTETFKLVRSASGNLYPMGNTIIAAGQQWEVVEDVPRRNKARENSTKSKESGSKERVSKEKVPRERVKEQETKERESKGRASKERESKDRESGSRREQRRSKDAETEAEQRRTTRQRNGRVPEHSVSASSSSGRPRTRSADIRHRPESQELMLSSQGEHKPSRRRDEDRERRPERSAEVTKQPTQLEASKPHPPPPTPRPLAPPKLERQSSTSNRPTSELPSTAELNSLKARDVWEMERLWKGRSMYGVETNGLAAPTSISSHVEVPPGVDGRDNPADGPSHGSSHTSFMVQTPFQVPPSSDIHYSIPSGPPPVIYPATSLSQVSYHPVVQHYAHNHRSLPASISVPSHPPASFQLTNPLPEPPKESRYTPSTLSDSNSTDYWTKYAGVTKAH